MAIDAKLQTKFKEALELVITEFMDGGMHTADMIEPLEAELKWAREATESSDNQ